MQEREHWKRCVRNIVMSTSSCLNIELYEDATNRLKQTGEVNNPSLM
jgi:hypothetical protein